MSRPLQGVIQAHPSDRAPTPNNWGVKLGTTLSMSIIAGLLGSWGVMGFCDRLGIKKARSINDP